MDQRTTDESTAPAGVASRLCCVLPWVLIGLGALPRLRHYFSGRALWFDEAALCINVLERGFGSLASPLDFKQIAPLFYLWWLKLSTLMLGSTVYAVRLPSLLGGLACLVLFWLVARRLLTKSGALLALAMAALSQHLIYYAGEAKPYAIDAAAFLVVVWLALWMDGGALKSRRLAIAGLILSLLVWLSYPVVFVIAGIGGVQLVRAAWNRNGTAVFRLAIPYAASALSFGVLLVLVVIPSRQDTVTMEYMNFYWRHGFMPFPSLNYWAIAWYRERTFMFFDMPGGFTLPGLALFCWLAGVMVMAARRPWYAAALLAPLVLTLIASCMKLYPFHGRMTVFLVPVIFLFMGEGIAWLVCGTSRTRYACAVILLALLLAQPAVRAARMAVSPSRHHELDAVLEDVAREFVPGDKIFLRQGDYIAYRFLEHRYDFPADAVEFEPRGTGAEGEHEVFLSGLDERAAGWDRVWFPMAYDYETTVAEYIEALQSRGTTFARHTARGASAYGIDFSP